MSHLLRYQDDQEWDNRDLEETWIHIFDGADTVEVRPWDLVENVIENALEDQELVKAFIERLRTLKTNIEEAQNIEQERV